ncbi:ATP-binding protein [Actinoplanes sp. TBRC 11911]|uniref:ATP-binding protein n=1 Tax=Actinoplanes sp. TBRC 11911 TaxID=2729386 RepID=UPI00145F22C1|nr:ATP-binding protein [Actinoplanes sp. TBRC 11911]NMO54265.1 ATP-binding protein [Actinoplanes sp. TBRC 11911]
MKGWRKRHPPGATEQVARWTLDQPPQLRTLRTALQTAVRSRALPATVDVTDLLERLLIVATELAGNALRHGQPPAVVALLQVDGQLIVDVADRDPVGEPGVDEQRPAGAGGLGLPLAQRLAQDVGWYATEDGKHVWAAIAVVAA